MPVISDTAMADLIHALAEAGLIPPDCRRVVIDIQQGEAVRVYHDTYADEGFARGLTSALLQVVAQGEVASTYAHEQRERKQTEQMRRMAEKLGAAAPPDEPAVVERDHDG